jgi:hypothetical protein
MHFAPVNEQGVVLLFADYARRRGWKVKEVRQAFPDCIVETSTGDELRIEFEFHAKSFKTHGHDAKKCDIVVCWVNDWPDRPKGLKVVELCREYGFGFNVWHQAVKGEYSRKLEGWDHIFWSVDPRAHVGDLVLFYHARPKKRIGDIFEITSEPTRERNAKWKKDFPSLKSSDDYECKMRLVARLQTPLNLSEIDRHPVLGYSLIVRRRMIGRGAWTPHYWWDLYQAIGERNPSLIKTLSGYSPQARLPSY